MALATTTASSAISATDVSIVVASATSMAAGRIIVVDQENMQVIQTYVSGTTVGVLRGRDGTAAVAHKSGVNVTHGLASDFAVPAAQASTTYPTGRAVIVTSVSATSTLTLPLAGSDMRVVMNGTSVITLTIPVPTKDMDGTTIDFVGNGVAAHLLTFTGGLSGAGGSYDIVTVNATAPVAFKVIAANGLWMTYCGPAITGTVTAITAAIA